MSASFKGLALRVLEVADDEDAIKYKAFDLMKSAMDSRFPLLLMIAAALAFGVTWYSLDSEPSVPKPGEKDAWMRPAGAAATAKKGEYLYFKTCEEARAAGAAPMMAGRPGYSSALDPDGTGVACPPN